MVIKSFDNLEELKNIIREGANPVSVTGMSGPALSYFFSLFLTGFDRPCLTILPNKKDAESLFRDLLFFMPRADIFSSAEARLFEFPSYEISPLTGLSPHPDIVTRRLEALYAMISNKNPVIITSIESISLRIMPKEDFVRSIEYLETGEDVERDPLLKKLEATGYQRTSLVEELGDYSVRGGVIDLFSPLYMYPVRLEFWGERLESIRQFDSLSQRSLNHLKEMVLLPVNEIIMERRNIKRARSMGRLPNQPIEGAGFSGQEAWLNHFYPHLDTLFQYLPENGLVTIFDPHRTDQVSGKIKVKFEKDVERSRLEAAQKGIPFPETEGLFIPYKEIEHQLEKRQMLDFSSLELRHEPEKAKGIRIKGNFHLSYDLEVRIAGKGRVSMAPLAEKIAEWLNLRGTVVLVCRTGQQADRLKEILENYDVHVQRVVKAWDQIPEGSGLSICLGRFSKGFLWLELGVFIVSEDEIFGSKRAGSRPKKKAGKGSLSWSSFSQLKAGDFVVHEEHGIGRYVALVKMEIQNKTNDFVIVEYAGNSRLFIPADRVSILQKYAGANEQDPKLDQLGGRSWNLTKRKAKKSVKKIAKQLIELYALRKHNKGFAFSAPDNYFREFEAAFEHEETGDQMKAIEDVLDDMTSERPMDRLICGDVGFGKTEVAVRAAFKAVSDGKQVAVLVPTTVLAEQHYDTFKKRMDNYDVGIGLISRFKTPKQQRETLGKVRAGEIDILIGTHRIIQKDVMFRELGLLIIDEEQRFGVKQKEALKRYRSLVDVLAITATPIPRSLHLSMMGIRDLSIIETAPAERSAIKTYLTKYDEPLIKRAVLSEIERGGQVFIVHNRVHSIDNFADTLKRLIPQARFAVAHGRMKERELERSMMRFLRKEIDVLVCTTIIESGLDIPSANTIIINKADRFGLAQIYQLRGRVGRSKEKAYAYLLVSNDSNMTRDAEKRLKALMDFSHLGAGLHLAMHDLKIRGGGNILGFSQSGHISAVGYEFYMKLIERAIAEIKGEEWHEDINPEINIDIPAYLPEDYVIDTDVRLNLYRRLSGLKEEEDLISMVDEVKDRFGAPPEEAGNLLGLMSVRLLLKGMGVSRLDVTRSSFTLTFSEAAVIDPEKIVGLASKKPKKYRFIDQNRLTVNMGLFPFAEAIPRIKKDIQIINKEAGLGF